MLRFDTLSGMLSRREWLAGVSSAAILRGAAMTSAERVQHALRGEEVDRTPFTFWRHFLDETKPAASHAQSTLAFHEKLHTDLVKVMSDYPFPKPSGAWSDVKVNNDPFPQQIQALRQIKEGLRDKAPFVETVFNPWNVAEKLSSREAVMALMHDNPEKLRSALQAIAQSEASHARKAVEAGASGILLAIANAQEGVMSKADYVKFSEPFDKMVLDEVRSAPLNILHLHTDARFGDKLYLDRFLEGWPAAAINYSLYTSIPVAELRKKYNGVIMAGLDERKFRMLTPGDLKRQWLEARSAAGKKFILAPGCSVPNDSNDEETGRLGKLFGAV